MHAIIWDMNTTGKIVLSMTMLIGQIVHTETESAKEYIIKDFSTDQQINTYASFTDAYGAWQSEKEHYDNLGIVQEERVLAAEYGIVWIPSGEGCTYNLVYAAEDGSQGYINGCYGKDAWYTGTSADGSTVSFVISGAKAVVPSENVEIVPLDDLNVVPTSYVTEDGMLYHRIRTSTTSELFSSMILLDERPEGLDEDQVYFSADGHLFYSSEKDLLDDLRENTQSRAVNSQPYYNYYQYLSHRSITSLSPAMMQKWLQEHNGISLPMNRYLDTDGDSVCDILNRSQYAGSVDAFYQYQYQYGANAVLMLALSCNESARGRSLLAYSRNNLFGHSAYDTSVEEHASRYLSPSNSIYSHARYYLSRSYCNPYWENYHGAYFGNKASGMNVSYASDPYWGEKAAAFCGSIARSADNADAHSRTLAVCKDGPVTVYQDSACTQVLYTASVIRDYAAVILEDMGTCYRIQSDLTVGKDDSDYAYDFADDIGYLRKEDVQIVFAGTGAENAETVHVTFDADGGTFADGTSRVQYAMYAGSDAACTIPVKEGMLFTGWDQDVHAIMEDTVFHAVYTTLDELVMESLPETEYTVGEVISLAGGSVRARTGEGDVTVPLETSMVSGFDLKTAGEQTVTVRYGGRETSYAINVSLPQKETGEPVDLQRVYDVMYMANQENISSEEARILITLKEDMDAQGIPALTMVQRRNLDALFRKAIGDHAAYVLRSEWQDAGVSGLAVALPLDDTMSGNVFSRHLNMVSLQETQADDSLLNVARMLGYEPSFAVEINVMQDGNKITLMEPLVISLPKPDEKQSYRIFRIGEGQDILECRTAATQHYIRFVASESGTYLISAGNEESSELAEDITESLTVKNSSFVHWTLAAVGGAAGLLILVILGAGLSMRRRRRRHDHHKR